MNCWYNRSAALTSVCFCVWSFNMQQYIHSCLSISSCWHWLHLIMLQQMCVLCVVCVCVCPRCPLFSIYSPQIMHFLTSIYNLLLLTAPWISERPWNQFKAPTLTFFLFHTVFSRLFKMTYMELSHQKQSSGLLDLGHCVLIFLSFSLPPSTLASEPPVLFSIAGLRLIKYCLENRRLNGNE